MHAFADWHHNSDDTRLWHETDDPRVVVVIEQDSDSRLSELFDGDAINPIYIHDYQGNGRLEFTGGYDDDAVASAWTAAYNRAPYWRDTNSSDFADRFVHTFHGAYVSHVTGGYRPDFEILVFDSPGYREHIGDTAENASQADADSVAQEVSRALDGEVYGIGYATSDAHRTNETPIDLDDPDQDWDVEIACWGLVGDTYATESALALEHGRPSLHPMLG